MKNFKFLAASFFCLFSINSFSQGCSNPNQSVPNLDNYWELKIAQGFNNMDLIKQLDKKFCYNYSVNTENYGNPIFQAYTKEQFDFFINKIPNFKDYKTTDEQIDVLLSALSLPYMYHDYASDDLKKYLLSRYQKYVPSAQLSDFETKHHTFWVNDERLRKDPQFLKLLIDYGNSILPYFNKSDLIKHDKLGNNALHYAVMTKNSKPLLYFKPKGNETLKKNDLGANLWHYAFLPAPDYLPKAYVEQELKIINEYLLSEFKPAFARFMTIGNPLNPKFPQVYPFEVFAYHMKDNNPELYNALREKYSNVFILKEEDIKNFEFNPEQIIKLFNQQIIITPENKYVHKTHDRG